MDSRTIEFVCTGIDSSNRNNITMSLSISGLILIMDNGGSDRRITFLPRGKTQPKTYYTSSTLASIATQLPSGTFMSTTLILDDGKTQSAIIFAKNCLDITDNSAITASTTKIIYNNGSIDFKNLIINNTYANVKAAFQSYYDNFTSDAAVTAAGTIYSNATAVDAQIVNITSGAANTGVSLRQNDTFSIIYNATTTSKIVYPYLGGTIGGLGANVGVVLYPGEKRAFFNFAQAWTSYKFENWTTDATFTATGTIFSDATPFDAKVITITTGADATGGLLNSGDTLSLIYNNTTSTKIVYPFAGGTIDGGGANIGVIIYPGQKRMFFQISANTWISYKFSDTSTVATGTEAANAVTIQGTRGTITSSVLTTAALGTYVITLTDASIVSTSRITPVLYGYSGILQTNGSPKLDMATPGTGSVVFTITNLHATNALAGSVKINFDISNS